MFASPRSISAKRANVRGGVANGRCSRIPSAGKARRGRPQKVDSGRISRDDHAPPRQTAAIDALNCGLTA
jgi:hypothetical protein